MKMKVEISADWNAFGFGLGCWPRNKMAGVHLAFWQIFVTWRPVND